MPDGTRGHPDAMRLYLLAGGEPEPYVQPWVRLHTRAVAAGLVCRPAGRSCMSCGSLVVLRTYLPRRAQRHDDPFAYSTCLTCGYIVVEHFGQPGPVEAEVRPEEWAQLTPRVSMLIQAVIAREKHEDDEAQGWDFS